MNDTKYRRGSYNWILALAGITGASATVYFTTYFIDKLQSPNISLLDLVLSDRVHSAMTGMPEVIAGILGITITVVAIIVELSANRYTPRVTHLFVRSPTNLGVLGFFVLSGLMCVWVSLTGGSSVFVPKVGTAVTIFAITASLLLLLPYFAFVFGFLDPHNIVEHMGNTAFDAIRRGKTGENMRKREAKFHAVQGIEQLTDVALNAIEHKDKGICMHAVDTLGNLALDYLMVKKELPRSWFFLDRQLKENPDFVSLQEDVLSAIEQDGIWFEMKILKQFQMLYGETLNTLRDINCLIAINTRKLAELAIEENRVRATALAVKFFNTYLRITINGHDVRTAYNVLNQYRLLAEFALEKQQYELAVEMTMRFKFYGQLGFSMGLPFVLETVAYDLCALNELAFDLDVPCRDQILAEFLEVDKEAEEDHELEASLRGVRKAQIKLATYYLQQGALDLARVIFDDMRGELPIRLDSIKKELVGIKNRDFWEISDRGVNFDYLEPERRDMLEEFFAWFETESKELTT